MCSRALLLSCALYQKRQDHRYSFIFSKLSEIDGDDPLTAFVTQFYLSESRASMYPKEIILDDKIEEPEVIAEAVKNIAQKKSTF